MSASSKPESQLHFLLFPCFLFKAKQALAFLTGMFGFALSSPQPVKRGADAVGTPVAEPLKPGSGTADLARDSREVSHLCPLYFSSNPDWHFVNRSMRQDTGQKLLK